VLSTDMAHRRGVAPAGPGPDGPGLRRDSGGRPSIEDRSHLDH